MDIKKHIKENESQILSELFGLLEIPSISSEEKHKPDMYRAAEYWKQQMLNIGLDSAQVFETDGNPVAFGEIQGSKVISVGNVV